MATTAGTGSRADSAGWPWLGDQSVAYYLHHRLALRLGLEQL